ncbi:MAG: AMP-binding protein, partial [Gemmatimonadetes bacterium]|nr:AMP-binding protein [Gemmatimonadota bacterium]
MENVESIYPLTGMQQAILLRVLRQPEAGEYVEQVSWTLEGEFDPAAFARAWRLAIDRHPVLRTSFFWEGLDQPLQVVRTHADLPVEEQDWQGVPEAERRERLARFLVTDRKRGFDLAAAPLMRLTRIRIAPDASHFVWTHHHLVVDGWSAALCLRDVFGFYEALCRGETPRPARTHVFREYVEWTARQDPAAGETFWRGVLDGFQGGSAPGVVRPGAREGERYGTASATVDGTLVERLQAAARRQQLTLNAVLQGAWGALLGAYTGEADVVFGSVVAGRLAQVPGADTMLGVFINTVPVRVRVRPGETVASWLKGVQAKQFRTRAHEHWSMAQVQGWSGLPRGQRLFETMFVFQDLPDVGVQIAEVAGQRVRDFARVSPTAGVGYALVLEVVPKDGLELTLAYDEARFDADSAGRLLAHLGVMLEAVADDLQRPADDLPLLTADERRRLLVEWNAGQTVADPRPVHLLVAGQAARTPDALAVVAGDERLTYAGLERRADRLARHLRGLGIGPEARVGVCTDRSAELVVAVLAIWKAGGAYVPLDPAYPDERLAFSLRDSGAAVLLTQTPFADRFAGTETTVVRLDGPLPRPLPHEGGGENDEALTPGPSPNAGRGENYGASDPSALPQNWGKVASLSEPDGGVLSLDSDTGSQALAYVIYTSGSTGTPKGVRVEHRQLAATLHAARTRFAPAADDVMPSLASYAFDIWLFETFLPLTSGASVRLVPAERVMDVPALVRDLEGATLLHAVPALMRQIVDE